MGGNAPSVITCQIRIIRSASRPPRPASRDVETERLGGPEVDRERIFGWQLHRQISRLWGFGWHTRPPVETTRSVDAVGHQSAIGNGRRRTSATHAGMCLNIIFSQAAKHPDSPHAVGLREGSR